MKNKVKYSETVNYELSVMYENETLLLHLKCTQSQISTHHKMEYNNASLPYELKKQSINTEEAYKMLLDRSNFDIDFLNAQIIINLKIIQFFEFDKEVSKKVVLQLDKEENTGHKSIFESTELNLNEIQENFEELLEELGESEWNIKFNRFRKDIEELKLKLNTEVDFSYKGHIIFYNNAFGVYNGQRKDNLPHGVGVIRFENDMKFEG